MEKTREAVGEIEVRDKQIATTPARLRRAGASAAVKINAMESDHTKKAKKQKRKKNLQYGFYKKSQNLNSRHHLTRAQRQSCVLRIKKR